MSAVDDLLSDGPPKSSAPPKKASAVDALLSDDKPAKPSLSDIGKVYDEQTAAFDKKSGPVQGFFEKMNRPTEAAYAKHAGRGYFDTLMHGVKPAQAQADAAKAYHDVGIGEGGDWGDQVVHTLAKAALDIGVNPLSLLGMPIKGMTTGQRITQALEQHGLPAATKAGEALSKVPGGAAATRTAAGLHDFFGVHSAAKRALAKKYGAGTGFQSPHSDLKMVESDVSGDKEYGSDFQKLTGRQGSVKRYTYHKGDQPVGHVEVSFPASGVPHVEDLITVPQFRKQGIAQAMLHDTSERLRAQGYKRVTASPNDIAEKANRQVWGPGQRTALNADGGTIGKNLEINDVHSLAPPRRNWLQEYATARARHMAESSNVAREAAGRPGLPYAQPPTAPDIAGLFPKDEQKQFEASPLTKLGDAQAGFFTAGMFAQPFSHGANIGSLGALVDPGAVVSALGRGTVDNAKKLVGKGETDAARDVRLAGPMQHGAVDLHPERESELDTGLTKTAEAVAKVPVIGKALALVPKAVRGLYRTSGDILWKFDDEVKAQRWQHLVDSGVNPDMAGLRTGGELVDYANKSPVAKNLRPVAPFATWRTKAPLAVARNAIENPGKTQAVSSLIPAAVGGKQDVNGKPYESSLPGAELNELTDFTPIQGLGLPVPIPKGPMKYAASSVGTWPRMVDNAMGIMFTQGAKNTKFAQARAKAERNRATYGQDLKPFVLNELPLVGQALQMSKHGMFNNGRAPTPLQDALSMLRFRPAR